MIFARHWTEAYILIVGTNSNKHKQDKGIQYGHMVGSKYIAIGEICKDIISDYRKGMMKSNKGQESSNQ